MHGDPHVQYPPDARWIRVGLRAEHQRLSGSVSEFRVLTAQHGRESGAAESPTERDGLRVVPAVFGHWVQLVPAGAPVLRAGGEVKDYVLWRHDVLLHDDQVTGLGVKPPLTEGPVIALVAGL